MELVRETVGLTRRAAARAPAEGAAGRRRSSISLHQPSSQHQATTEADDASIARSKLARLLPDTPADQLLASLEAASSSSAGELKVRDGGRRES